jgi:hypothetical protein
VPVLVDSPTSQPKGPGATTKIRYQAREDMALDLAAASLRYQAREDMALDLAAASLKALAYEQRTLPPNYRPYFVK